MIPKTPKLLFKFKNLFSDDISKEIVKTEDLKFITDDTMSWSLLVFLKRILICEKKTVTL